MAAQTVRQRTAVPVRVGVARAAVRVMPTAAPPVRPSVLPVCRQQRKATACERPAPTEEPVGQVTRGLGQDVGAAPAPTGPAALGAGREPIDSRRSTEQGQQPVVGGLRVLPLAAAQYAAVIRGPAVEVPIESRQLTTH